MINKVTVFASLALVLGLHSALGGDITGKVTLKGAPPAEVNLPFDALCKRTVKPGVTPTTRFYAADASGGLADVFVYLKKAPATPTPSEAAVLDQVSCEYSPYVIGAQVGQTILVKNSDPVLHNVHPTPKVSGNKEHNKAQLPKGPALSFSWDNPELFLRFKCDVHPWMFAYVGLVEHSYFAVTKEDGTFTIKNVPAGDYEIEAVHRKTHTNGKGIVSKVTVGADGGQADFVVDISK
jgi:plastocyanin